MKRFSNSENGRQYEIYVTPEQLRDMLQVAYSTTKAWKNPFRRLLLMMRGVRKEHITGLYDFIEHGEKLLKTKEEMEKARWTQSLHGYREVLH